MNRSSISGRGPACDDETGAVLVLYVFLMVVILGMAALLVDLGQQRVGVQEAQSIADMSSLAAAVKLSGGNPTGACQDAISSVNANAKDLWPKINAADFCSQTGNNVAMTTCSVVGGTTQAKPAVSAGRYTVKMVYPVLPGDLTDPYFSGAGTNDGPSGCMRLGTTVTIENSTTFAKVLGVSRLSSSRLAVMKAGKGGLKLTPALWVLDPFGCSALSVSGSGTSVNVGTPAVPGIIAVDSNGTTGCTGGQTVVDVPTGQLRAVPTTGTSAGFISIFATGAATCAGHSCDPDDVSGSSPRVSPAPIQATERATRSPVDWRFNCKAAYSPYHAIALEGCPDGTPSYIDNLASAVGNTVGVKPNASFQLWSPTYSCNPSGTITVPGNSLVNCPTFTIGTGTSITFTGGNVVFDGDIKMTGGALAFNTANPATALPDGCRPPSVSNMALCLSSSSANAAFVYMRNGEMNITGGSLNLRHVFVYQRAGAVKDTGGAAPVWSPPSEGAFGGLSLWSEFSDVFSINGGGGLQLAGTFFTPEAAPFKITGGGGLAQQSAQFISYRLDISGGGNLFMAPPDDAVPVAIKGGLLIR